jgi:hypothetical protein
VPTHDEDIPRLAEIARTLSDFRAEFRSAITDMVRKDVYSAHMASMQLQIDALKQDNRGLREELEKDRSDLANDRRSLRNVTVGAILSTVVAIVVLILEVLVK